jgi:hypothetical protein
MLALALSLILMPPDPLADLHRFPPADVALRFYNQSQEHLQFLNDRWKGLGQYSRHANEWSAWYQEQLNINWAWWCLKESQIHYYGFQRQDMLKKLRDQLGDEAFLAGRMPPPVAVWRFERTD